MKNLTVFVLGFAAGLYFSDYRAARFVKHETGALVAAADRLLR